MLRQFFTTALLLAMGEALVPGLPGPGAAQSTGSVTGTVSLEGVGLPGIPVTIRGEYSERAAVTDGSGRFLFARLHTGEHSIVIPRMLGDLWVRNPERLLMVEPGNPKSLAFQAEPIQEVVVTVIPDSARGARVAVSPNPLYIVPGQVIRWRLDSETSGAGPFTIHFEPISPLDHRRMHAAAGEPILGQVREFILPGKYRYFVAVLYRGRIYTEDPELIDDNGVEPPRSPSGGAG
jgi:hypothetical protein